MLRLKEAAREKKRLQFKNEAARMRYLGIWPVEPSVPLMVHSGAVQPESVRARKERLFPIDERTLPLILTAKEAARVMRKPSMAAFYAAVERGHVPGVLQDGSKIQVDRDVLLKTLQSRRQGSR